MILVKIITYYLHLWMRFAYWLYNLGSARIGKNASIEFPLKLEGKGCLEIGINATLGKDVDIGIGSQSSFIFGENVVLKNNATIRISQKSTFRMGNNCVINKNSQLYIHKNWTFGNVVQVATNCALLAREPKCYGSLNVGDGVSIGDNTIIDMSSDVTIGSHVAIGPNCAIYTHDHDYKEKKEIPWHGTPKLAAVNIEEGAWIGASAIILPGCTIGAGSIVAAGSVVNKSVAPYTLVAGVPAKMIKEL